MKIEEFCSLNGITARGTFIMMDRCVFPEGEFVPEFMMVVYSLKGSARVMVDGREYQITRRCMSVFRDGQNLELVEKSDNFETKVLLVGGDLGMELSISNVFLTMFIIDETPIIKVSADYAKAATLFFDSLSRVVRFDNNPYQRECLLSLLRAFFYSTGYFLFQSLKYKGGDLYHLADQMPDYGDNIVSRFTALVEKYSRTKRTLAFYAEQLDYNPKYLSALIKRQTGKSGQNLINQYAALFAMAKLTYTNRSVKEISNEMDFPSQSDFGKFFKRMTGVSPVAYRASRKAVRGSTGRLE